MPDRAIGVSDLAPAAGVVEYRTRERTAGGPVEQFVLGQRERVRSFTGHYVSPANTLSATAPSVGGGVVFLYNQAGSPVIVMLRSVEFQWLAPTFVSGIESSVDRVAVERFTSASNPSAAEAAFVSADSDQAHNASVKLVAADTGMVITTGDTLFVTNSPLMTTVGPSVPNLVEYRPRDAGAVLLRAGEGAKVRQLDTGVLSDTRAYVVSLSWDEFTLP